MPVLVLLLVSLCALSESAMSGCSPYPCTGPPMMTPFPVQDPYGLQQQYLANNNFAFPGYQAMPPNPPQPSPYYPNAGSPMMFPSPQSPQSSPPQYPAPITQVFPQSISPSVPSGGISNYQPMTIMPPASSPPTIIFNSPPPQFSPPPFFIPPSPPPPPSFFFLSAPSLPPPPSPVQTVAPPQPPSIVVNAINEVHGQGDSNSSPSALRGWRDARRRQDQASTVHTVNAGLQTPRAFENNNHVTTNVNHNFPAGAFRGSGSGYLDSIGGGSVADGGSAAMGQTRKGEIMTDEFSGRKAEVGSGSSRVFPAALTAASGQKVSPGSHKKDRGAVGETADEVDLTPGQDLESASDEGDGGRNESFSEGDQLQEGDNQKRVGDAGESDLETGSAEDNSDNSDVEASKENSQTENTSPRINKKSSVQSDRKSNPSPSNTRSTHSSRVGYNERAAPTTIQSGSSLTLGSQNFG